MIKIHKGPPPAVLVANGAAWTAALLKHEQAGTTPTATELNRYNHPEIKAALIAETHGKCAYCESKFAHITYGDIEHIVPKKTGAIHRFAWENLTIACDRCNTNKGSHTGLVDPHQDDPEQFFIFVGPMLLSRPEPAKAYLTELTIDLNRLPLHEKRKEKAAGLYKTLMLARGHASPDVGEAIRNNLQKHDLSDSAEFAAMARAFFSAAKQEGFAG